ncbi:sugar phosphate nucleotidyltransferase, partial [Alphaproteobacteria bacterium]|nr:sugar phosphate nucleotidyltransferase [Alphaproteobacteria bacterium]
GVYFLPKTVFHYADTLNMSSRNELEITDILKMYLIEGNLLVEELGRGTVWFDAGTYDDLTEVAGLIRTIEKNTATLVNCPEEIAYRNHFIDATKLRTIATRHPSNPYSDYLHGL